MSIDRQMLKASFKKNNFPSWVCPSCKKGILVEEPGSFNFGETAESRRLIEENGFDPAFAKGYYCVFLKCNNQNCLECVIVSGKGGFEEEQYIDIDGGPSSRDIETLRPIYSIPPLHMFPIPNQTPPRIKNEILASFNLFWADQSASVNHIRRCIEEILTERRIRKYSVKNGKRNILSLHDRIIEYGKRNEELSEDLLAIKWLGNAASHPEEFSIDDVIDAYEILEVVLDEIYVGRTKKIKKKVKILNKTKRPIRRGKQ